ncbi:guanine nucleotide exchange factor vps9 [Phlyctema vagabunda]|uniref:Guanine nucleotide exchange factor vps9 n=1 Tax=Phlyctema vagabunda TaxID=108571 RepID=A0ABR4PBI6_9HELO
MSSPTRTGEVLEPAKDLPAGLATAKSPENVGPGAGLELAPDTSQTSLNTHSKGKAQSHENEIYEASREPVMDEDDSKQPQEAYDPTIAVESKDALTSSAGLQDTLESSTATLKPLPSSHTVSHFLSPEDTVYVDPTPKTPAGSQTPSRSTSSATSAQLHTRKEESTERSPTRSDAGFDDKHSASEDEREVGSRAEIQSIMEQFSEEGSGPGHEEVMSPRLEFANPLLGSPMQHPPRKSSLEPLNASMASPVHSLQDLRISTSDAQKSLPRDPSDIGPAVPPKPGSIRSFGLRGPEDKLPSVDTPNTPSLHRPPPPEPEPEPDLPFDFHRFLEQLRHRTADPVAKFLRSFLQEFGKKQWMVHEQVKIIGDFLAFITNKMGQCEVWREVSDAEFDNAREGMEKLVMNRLYTQTFSPAIPAPQPIPGPKPKRKGAERPMGPGRRGQHQEDVERDDILAQKVSIYGWIKEEHLDISPVGESGKRFLILAQQELLKIKTYRAPRDKIICVLNCCKVIFGLLKHSKSDSSADSFMPLLIYVVLHANPEHLVSNVQYILRFRNQDKLGGEAGYYLSSLMGAVQFIENLDRTSLTISDEDFEHYVEAAVSAIAEKHQAEVAQATSPTILSEKSSISRPEVTPRHSMEGESSMPRKSTSSNDYENSDGGDEKAAMSGLLRTIQRPLSSIGRIFSEDGPSSQGGPARTPVSGITPRPTPPLRVSTERPRSSQRTEPTRGRLSAEDAAARQASAEAAEAHRLQRAEHENVVETLAGMFPDLDREIISDVVTQKEGRVGLAVDACLALSM